VASATGLTISPRSSPAASRARCDCARVINQPKIILADEPTGNLDEANETIVSRFSRALSKRGHTILMVTHAPDIARQADRRSRLAHGHLHFARRSHVPGHP